MIDLIIWLAVIVIGVGIVWYLLSELNLPEPIGRWVRIAVVAVVGVIIILLLLSMSGSGPPMRMRW